MSKQDETTAVDSVEHILITQEDLDQGVYAFEANVTLHKRIGVSLDDKAKKDNDGKPTSKVDMTLDLTGVTVKDLVAKLEYDCLVAARKSFRDYKWIPADGTKVTVYARDNGKVLLENLPPDVQAIAIFASLEEPHRSKAIQAFLSTQ